MADSPLLPDKEQEDEATNDREWNVQVAGRVVLGLAVLAALAGLFGAGPLSWSSEAAGDGSIEVEYKRFARSGGPADLSLSVPVSGADREARVWLDAGYLESLDIEQITPEPQSQIVTGDQLVLTFEVQEGTEQLRVSISATADAVWRQEGRAGVVGAGSVDFWQLFYP